MEQLLMDNEDNNYVFDINQDWLTTDLDYTVTIDTTANDEYLNMNGITVNTVDIDAITLDDSTYWATNIDWEQTEFVNKMPSLDKINNMCEHYPALKKAFENLKSIYKMVHQDYVGNHEKDDEVPF